MRKQNSLKLVFATAHNTLAGGARLNDGLSTAVAIDDTLWPFITAPPANVGSAATVYWPTCI